MAKKKDKDKIEEILKKLKNKKTGKNQNRELGRSLLEHAYKLLNFEDGGELNPSLNMQEQQLNPLASIPIFSELNKGFQQSQANSLQMGKNVQSLIKNNMNQIDNNPYMQMGGQLKEYNLPDHSQGGGVIDKNLNPTSGNGIAELEKEETSYTFNQKNPYIFSDKLQNPETGNTFAKDSKKINKKYELGGDLEKIGKNLEMSILAKKNDNEKMMAQGGEVNKYELGGNINDPLAYLRPNTYRPLDRLESTMPVLNPLATNTNRPLEHLVNPIQPFDPLPSKVQLRPLPDNLPSNPPSGILPYTEEANKVGINGNVISAAMKGMGLAHSAYEAMQPSEKEKMQLNPNLQEVESLMEGRGIDFTPLLNEITMGANAGLSTARNSASNANNFAALGNKILAGAGRQASMAKLEQQKANNEYRAQEASTKFQTGESSRSEKIRQQTVQSQNDAAQRGFVRQFFSDLSQAGTTVNKFQNFKDQVKNNKELARMTIDEGLALLGAKHTNFGISGELVDKLRSGEYSGADLDKFMDAVIKYKG
jgi:hypothetical protein